VTPFANLSRAVCLFYAGVCLVLFACFTLVSAPFPASMEVAGGSREPALTREKEQNAREVHTV
jgi:hypothetical protein